MQRGDLLAYGVNMAAGIDAPPTLIPPPLWSVARPHFGFDKPTIHYGRPRYTLPAPEAGTVTGLPKGLRLHGVRIKSAALAASPMPAAAPKIPSTGAPGRPTSMHLIRVEHRRRLDAGEAHESLAEEAKHLATWLAQQHPAAPQPTTKTVENAIREAHRRRATRPQNTPPKYPPEIKRTQ
jgi:hypothetical protein